MKMRGDRVGAGVGVGMSSSCLCLCCFCSFCSERIPILSPACEVGGIGQFIGREKRPYRYFCYEEYIYDKSFRLFFLL